MKTVVDGGVSPRVGLERPAVRPARSARPVLWWAALGAAFLAQALYLLVRYLTDLPENVPAGPTDVPFWMAFNIHAQELFFGGLTIFFLVKLVVLPLIRRQPIPWDGLMLMAVLSMVWQNYLINYIKFWSTYNSVLINRGSWYSDVFFWHSPNASSGFAEAPLWDFGFYGFWAICLIWFNFMMRQVKKKWPHLGKFGLFGITTVFCMVLDFAAEDLFMRLGLYTYAGVKGGWYLLFDGRYYQFPLYESLLYGPCLAAMACVRYYKNDRGESVAERRIDEVRVGRRGKTWIRFLAIAGIMNLCLFTYNVAIQPFVLGTSGEWPEDIQKRSYFTQGVCGAATDRFCPGPGIPIDNPNSAYLNSKGGVSYPPGWTPPSTVPFAD